MIGAIIGDIVGSRFEFVEDGCRGKDFALFASGCRFTDDSLMTLAVAKSLLLSKGNYDNLGELTIQIMKDIAKPYPYKIDEEGRVVADSYGYGCIAYVGVVLQSVCEKLKGILKEKSKILPCDK